MTNTEFEPLMAVCRKFTDEAPEGVVIPEPYIPFIPENWNSILVLAEAQNLSDKGYSDGLRRQGTDECILRLLNAKNKNGIGVKPWDDWHAKLALKAMIPKINLTEVAVSNAVPWSCLNEKGENANPTGEMQEQAGKFWKDLFAAWEPDLKKIIVLGNVAEGVMIRAAQKREDWLKLRLPSLNNLNRVQGMFDREDLLRRFSEVKKAAEALGKPDLVKSHSHVFFACHAVSLGSQKLQAADTALKTA